MISINECVTLENYLNNLHPEIIKSINNESYQLDYNKFDLFYEILFDGEVVGFIALENDDLNKSLIINECYIIPDKRGNNLFIKSYADIVNNNDKQVFIRKPNKNMINVLLDNYLAFKMENDIVISYIDFIVGLDDTFKNSKIKHNYKNVKNDDSTFIANLFDLNLSSVLFFDDKHIFSKNYDILCICEARKYDLRKYSIRKKLKKIQPKYLNETFKIISDNLKNSFDYFKNINTDLSNSNKARDKFLNENPKFKDKQLDKIYPIHDFIFDCPFCGEITQKSAIHCHTCGLNLEKTLIRNGKKFDLLTVEDSNDFEDYYQDVSDEFDLDDEIQGSLDEIRDIFDSEEEMKNAFSKLIRAAGELAFASNEIQKEALESLNTIDYDYLELNRDKYDSMEDNELNIEKSIYALVKYANEHPTPWMFDYYLESIDMNAFDWIIEKGYLTKVTTDEFPELFKDCTVEELIRESELYHDSETTKEDMIKYFMDSYDFGWIVSEKGLEYLKAHPFLNFFTNNLLDFNIYEFKLYSDKYQNELTLEDIGEKYVNAKLTKALSNNELDLYLNYVDFYFNLNLSKNNYETAFIYLIQRIIYEINIWHLKDYHVRFDEALSIKTDYLLFKITKLNLDFDLESLYDEAYNSLKIEKIKFKYNENYDILRCLMDSEDVFDISSELLDQAEEQGKLKSLF